MKRQSCWDHYSEDGSARASLEQPSAKAFVQMKNLADFGTNFLLSGEMKSQGRIRTGESP